MPKLELTYDLKKPYKGIAILDGVDVSKRAQYVIIAPMVATLHLFDEPQKIVNGDLAETVIELDEITVNAEKES